MEATAKLAIAAVPNVETRLWRAILPNWNMPFSRPLGTPTPKIFGQVNDKLQGALTGEPLEIGYRQDVAKGPAWIRSNVSGELRDYEIEIQRVDYNPIQENKSLVIRVVDKDLLHLTGGIVQGMSGSPIIQNGKLVGAVTHVFVQDSTRGYGIFVEDMMRH